MECRARGQRGGDIIRHNSPTARERLEPRDPEGLEDVVKAKKRESGDRRDPEGRRAGERAPPEEAKRHHDEFIQHDLTGVAFPEATLGLAADPDRVLSL